MDGTRGVYWRSFWLTGLLCAVFLIAPVSSYAAIRKNLTPAAPHQISSSGTAVYSRNGSSLHGENAIEGEYIPSDYTSSRGTKLPVKSAVDHSIPRIIKHGSNAIRGGLVGIASGIALGAMLEAVGGFIDDNQESMKAGCLLNGNPVDASYCKQIPSGSSGVYQYGACNYYPASETLGKVKIFTYQSNIYAHQAVPFSSVSALLSSGWVTINNCTNRSAGYVPDSDAKFPVAMRKLLQSNEITPGAVPLTESDYSTMETFADGQNAEWLRSLMKESCTGSTSPDACIDSLSVSATSYLNGPATLQGPATTTTSLSTGADGVTSQTTTTTTTTYNITYGDNYYDYKTTTTKTATTDGVETGSETTTDGDEVLEEVPEESTEEDQVTSSPCAGSACDGPAYEDLYQPTDKTKEGELDSYASRVAAIPIIAAVSGLFNVSASGACPVWSYVGSADILGFSMDIDLTFDYLCQPWFTSYGPWIQAVMLLLGIYAAIRIALL